MSVLGKSFYNRSTQLVAKELIGKKLVRFIDGQKISGMITETEAYLGIKDPACHTFENKKSVRNQSMYLDGGHSYVYFIYGMYFCFNVVTKTYKAPEAVLIRSLEPLEGVDLMRKFRKKDNIKNLTTGPGKLCQALAIDKSCDGISLLEKPLYIEEFKSFRRQAIISRPRIGIPYAGEAKEWPLRFYLKDNGFISKK